MLPVRLHPEAEDDFCKALQWYHDQSPEAARHFSDAVDSALIKIAENPEAYAKMGKKFRAFVLHDFPYYLVYEVAEAEIVVMAVAHGSRRKFWKHRK
jgi:plasmid stabilization system protein ParE